MTWKSDFGKEKEEREGRSMRKKSSAEALIIGRCANDTQGLPLGSLTTIGQKTIENQKVKVKI